MIEVQRRPAVLSLLEGKFAALARLHRVPGAQLAIHDGRDTVTVEAGELEHGTGRRVTRDAAFPIGSISKSFTATVAMILVADGDLELDEPLGRYLPELRDLGDQLTLRQVLSHTGGLAADVDTGHPSTVTARRYVTEHCRSENLVLPPGTAFSYSNMGYVLAGHLIETVTGMSWWDSMESILLRPLGIEPAFVVAPGSRPSGRPVARGHSVNRLAGRTRPVEQSLIPAQAPAGALAVSAEDLVKFGLLHAGRGAPELLSAGCAEEMRQPAPAADPFGLANGWGLGLAVFREGSTDWVGHDGNAEGTSCHLRVDPASGWVIGLTGNANTGTDLWQDLRADLERAGIPIGVSRAWALPASPVAPPSGCAGTYANGDLEFVVVAGRDGQPSLAINGDGFERMTFHDDLTFSLRDPGSSQPAFGGRFLRDPATGHIDGLQAGGRLALRRSWPARAAAGAVGRPIA
ncbi:MAG: hypothetical protein QOE61_1734 [Micromonosporaceae bacterium]|nr:hypothetical protein [Micromonosporaceae bacterium]